MGVRDPEYHSIEANVAGLTSPAQRAEMKLLLAGRWPPLKPLPVFKYETDEFRASIDFDKLRGEWVCRKTSFPSNNIQELRGGLTEITMSLPHGSAEALNEDFAAEPQEQELEKDAHRRLQAMREWKENHESGALYSELRGYLSENQQDEIDESIRLSLTARQLQFAVKNIAYVFDALSKAGGRLATLIEVAQRNKAEHRVGTTIRPASVPHKVECQVLVETIHPARERRLQTRIIPASGTYAVLGDSNGGTILNMSETGMAVAAAEPLTEDEHLSHVLLQLPSAGQTIELSAQVVWLAESRKDAGIRFVDLTAETRIQISNWIAFEKPVPAFECLTPDVMVPAAIQVTEIAVPQIRETRPSALVEGIAEKVRDNIPVTAFRSQPRTRRVEQAAIPIGDSPARPYLLELSVTQIATFALVFLVVVIGVSVWLTGEHSSLGKRIQDVQNSILAADGKSPAVPRLAETTPRASTPPPVNAYNNPTANPSAPETGEAHPANPSSKSLDAQPAGLATHVGTSGSTSLVAGNTPPPASPKPTHASSAVLPTPNTAGISAPRVNVTPGSDITPHPSPRSTILVRGPGNGNKPFKLVLPEKTIAASSSFAMATQFSILVSPERHTAVAHPPARLQAGELISFAWPKYPSARDRYGSAETVKVRTTIGQLGQVQDIKFVSGSMSLFPSARDSVRQWRYTPTLLNQRPVRAQQDVTIAFRPQQRLSHAHTQVPSHN